MNYLNIHTDLLRSENYLDAPASVRGTWLNLLGWCATQENSGVISACVDWPASKWMRLCGICKEDLDTTNNLFRFQGPDLFINDYPLDSQEAVIKKRELGRLSGLKGGRGNRREPTSTTPDSPTPTVGKGTLSENKPKGKERKGKEKKGNGDNQNPPTIEMVKNSAEDFIKTNLTPDTLTHLAKNFAALIALEFHSFWSSRERPWTTNNHQSLLTGAKWKHRLTQHISEAIRHQLQISQRSNPSSTKTSTNTNNVQQY